MPKKTKRSIDSEVATMWRDYVVWRKKEINAEMGRLSPKKHIAHLKELQDEYLWLVSNAQARPKDLFHWAAGVLADEISAAE